MFDRLCSWLLMRWKIFWFLKNKQPNRGRLAQWESVCLVNRIRLSQQPRFLTNWWEVFCARGNQNPQPQFLKNLSFSMSAIWLITPSTGSNMKADFSLFLLSKRERSPNKLVQWCACTQLRWTQAIIICSTTQLYTNNSATSRQLWL